MKNLLRIEKSTYVDQYGFQHDCWEVLEECLVHPTGEHHTYQYYTETIKNPKYQDCLGREWICMVPTDYGGSSSWSRYEDGKRVDERWVGEYQTHGLPTYYGLNPLIRKDKYEEYIPNQTCSRGELTVHQ